MILGGGDFTMAVGVKRGAAPSRTAVRYAMKIYCLVRCCGNASCHLFLLKKRRTVRPLMLPLKFLHLSARGGAQLMLRTGSRAGKRVGFAHRRHYCTLSREMRVDGFLLMATGVDAGRVPQLPPVGSRTLSNPTRKSRIISAPSLKMSSKESTIDL